MDKLEELFDRLDKCFPEFDCILVEEEDKIIVKYAEGYVAVVCSSGF